MDQSVGTESARQFMPIAQVYGLVEQHRGAGQVAEAIEHVKRAIELAPQTALFHANLGEMYRLASRADLALEHGKRAIAFNPDYLEALSNIGVAAIGHRRVYEEFLDPLLTALGPLAS